MQIAAPQNVYLQNSTSGFKMPIAALHHLFQLKLMQTTNPPRRD
jgi:hypothetical protein